MGNSADNRLNLLAKNWTPLTPSTYKNTITEELIDEHELTARNEEQLTYNNSLLLKRTAINHPNVIKLIYFYQQQPSSNICDRKTFKHRIYTEHALGTIASLLPASQQGKSTCYCCSVMNGIGCLVEKYGYFGVSPTMVFLVNAVGLSRLEQKKIAKVWINEDITRNHTEVICNQQEMCFHLYELFQLMLEKGFCSKISLKDLAPLNKFKDFFECIYYMHRKISSPAPAERKRITSQLNNYQASKMQRNIVFVRQEQKNNNLNIKKANIETTNYSSRQSLLHKVNNSFSNFIQHGNSPKWSQQLQTVRSKTNLIASSQKALPILFLKGERIAKQVDLQQKSSQRQPKHKINFSYADNLATPKDNKNFQWLKTNKVNHSPHQQLASIHFQSISKNKQLKSTLRQVNKPKVMSVVPPVSYFNCIPNIEVVETTTKILEPVILENKEAAQQKQQVFGQPHLSKQQSKQRKVLSRPNQLTLNNSLSSQAEERKLTRVKKQTNLRLQKCVDLQWNAPESAKSLGSNRVKPSNFQIFNEYRFSFEPDNRIPNFNMDQSKELIEISSERLLKEKIQSDPSDFHGESHPEIGQSVQSQQFTHESKILDYAPVLRTSGRKGSFPTPQPTLNTKPIKVMQKLDHFSKGIANSINSSGTKRSIPGKSDASQDMPIVHENEDYLHHQRIYSAYVGYPQQEGFPSINLDYPHYQGFYSANLDDYQPQERFLSANQLTVTDYGRNNRKESDYESCYSDNDSMDERKKMQILKKINNTQKILEENKRKLEKLQLEKDLQVEKDMIKKEMESLLKNNLMTDETHRIKEKVKHKKATFAELKAQASKILNL